MEIPAKDAPVLVVDDDEGLLLSIKATLISAGLPEPALVSDSRRVMGLLRLHRYRLVLLDLMMPNVGGMEVLHQIREELPDTDCVIVSAVDDVSTAVAAMHSGAIDYLVNNAFSFTAKALDATARDWERSFFVGPVGYARMIQNVVEPMRRRGGGAIVNVASLGGIRAWPSHLAYCASKAALLMRPSSKARLSDWLYSRKSSPSSMPSRASATIFSTVLSSFSMGASSAAETSQSMLSWRCTAFSASSPLLATTGSYPCFSSMRTASV
mgnify:CR=1 FL=1